MQKILIVSLRAGAGHIMAAKALEEELRQNHSEIEVKNVDLLDYSTILSQEFYGKWYLDLVNAVPQFYGWLYDNIKPDTTDLRLLSDRMNTQKFQELLFDFDPDLVLATNFVPANLATFWRKKYHKKYKVAMALTDYEAHGLWVDKKVDQNYVATSEVSQELADLGIDEAKIKITGIPVAAKYSQPMSKDEIRQKLAIEDNFTILITSGGFGVGPVAEIIEKLAALTGKMNILAMAGRNEELFKKIEEIKLPSDKIKRVFSFIDYDQELMAVSDIVIGKPGGLTSSETLAVGRPMIMIDPIPGQEVANANYLSRNLAGIRADDVDEIIKIVRNLLTKNYLLEELTGNVHKLSRPTASREIINDILKFIQ